MLQTTEKTFTRQLPALCENCVLTPAVTTDVNKQFTTACPLFPAAAIRSSFHEFSQSFPIYYRTVWSHKAELNIY